jgi:hypothetical protein
MEKPSSDPGSKQTTPAAEYHKETEQETQAAIARIKQHISNGKASIAAQKTKNPAAVAPEKNKLHKVSGKRMGF